MIVIIIITIMTIIMNIVIIITNCVIMIIIVIIMFIITIISTINSIIVLLWAWMTAWERCQEARQDHLRGVSELKAKPKSLSSAFRKGGCSGNRV